MNGDKLTKFLIPLVFFLLGTIGTGAGMVIRGDFLGHNAAAAVESRVRATIKREADLNAERYREIAEQLREIRQKLDNP